MKVSVTLSIDVDPAAWDLNYGTGTRAADVRPDVLRYVLGCVQGSAAAEDGSITFVRLGMASGARTMPT